MSSRYELKFELDEDIDPLNPFKVYYKPDTLFIGPKILS
jgi:hypothetical protein